MLKEIGQEVKKYSWIGRLDEHEKLLKSRFPEEVRDLYIEFIKKEAVRVSDRKRYQELVGYLKKSENTLTVKKWRQRLQRSGGAYSCEQ